MTWIDTPPWVVWALAVAIFAIGIGIGFAVGRALTLASAQERAAYERANFAQALRESADREAWARFVA